MASKSSEGGSKSSDHGTLLVYDDGEEMSQVFRIPADADIPSELWNALGLVHLNP